MNLRELGTAVRRVKERVLADLGATLTQACQSLQARGCEVHLAATAEEARNKLAALVGKGPAVLAASPVLEEIEAARFLRERGISVDHTGLAEALLEALGRPGDHPRRPARRLTEKEIRQGLAMLTGAGGMEEFRRWVRDRAAQAACGITGAEAVVARFGSLVNVETEGNWGIVSNLPPMHVAVAGIDQIVWDYDEALAVVRAVAASAWGVRLGSYVSVVTGPSSTSDVAGCNVRGMHGPKTVHVILLDNGRRAALEQGFEELLYCLRCGACLEVCPVYTRLGRAFGGPYWGGRGVVAAALAEGPEGARRLGLEACLLDGRCREACPLRIDVPQALARLRGQI